MLLPLFLRGERARARARERERERERELHRITETHTTQTQGNELYVIRILKNSNLQTRKSNSGLGELVTEIDV